MVPGSPFQLEGGWGVGATPDGAGPALPFHLIARQALRYAAAVRQLLRMPVLSILLLDTPSTLPLPVGRGISHFTSCFRPRPLDGIQSPSLQVS